MKHWRGLVLAIAAITTLAGATLWLMQQRCRDGGGAYDWASAACQTSRPIILQGDIHRV